jgi:hypothetical protein
MVAVDGAGQSEGFDDKGLGVLGWVLKQQSHEHAGSLQDCGVCRAAAVAEGVFVYLLAPLK